MPYTWQTPKTDWLPTDTWDIDAPSRVHNNCLYIQEEFARLGISSAITSVATQTVTDLITETLLSTIGSNINALASSWVTPTGWIVLNTNWVGRGLTYTDTNAFEQNLQLLKDRKDLFSDSVLVAGHPLAICASSKTTIF